MTLLEETLDEVDAPAWASVAVPPLPDRSMGAPLLTSMVLPVEGRLVRAWVNRLLQRATRESAVGIRSLAQADARRLGPLELLEAAVCQDQARLDRLSVAGGVDARTLSALAQLAAIPLLQACRRGLEGRVCPSWGSGYCPICGAWPTLAELRGLERAFRLRCGRCGSDWGVLWLRCPYCGEADHERLGALVSEGNGETRKVSTCMTCKGYIKTFTTLQANPPHLLLVEDLATVDLDLVALERGYARPQAPGYPLNLRLVEPPGRLRTLFGRRR